MKTSMSKYEKGQALMVATIFFMIISVIVVMGLILPVTTQNKMINELFLSRGSYFLAESGVEDAIYRLQNRMPVAASQPFSLSGYSANTIISDINGGKVLNTTADWDGKIRKVEVHLGQGIGVAFNYGIQSGQGGFSMDNNSGIIGNIYSNGSITGGTGTYITGSAFAANSIALSADQSNMTPVPPPTSLNFRNAVATQDVAQKFQVSVTEKVNKAQFYIKKVGSPADATVKIVNDNNGSPGTTILTSGTLSASQVGTAYAAINVVFTSNPSLVLGTNYWIVIDNGSQSGTSYYTIGTNPTSSYSLGDGKIGQQGGTWSVANADLYFAIYLGGVNSTISGLTIGTGSIGDVWAHTVTNSTAAGNLWCQSGSGNNKACDTSKVDPPPQPMPISDANINQWKTDAAAGGVFVGDKTYDGVNGSLGPLKIVGNLTINNGAHITLNGVLWVTGDITVENNGGITVASSYASGSGVIVTDGRIIILNNGNFNGSGDPNSYLLAVTTSDCPTSPSCGGNYAVSVRNNAGAVILNAQNGTIDFSNGASASEATAYFIHLSNNAVIEYKTGLANQNFLSGPSGGWEPKSWKEIQ